MFTPYATKSYYNFIPIPSDAIQLGSSWAGSLVNPVARVLVGLNLNPPSSALSVVLGAANWVESTRPLIKEAQ